MTYTKNKPNLIFKLRLEIEVCLSLYLVYYHSRQFAELLSFKVDYRASECCFLFSRQCSKTQTFSLVVSMPLLRRNFAISDCIKCLELSLGQGRGSSITLLPCRTACSISCFFCSMSSVTWKVTMKALSVGMWALAAATWMELIPGITSTLSLPNISSSLSTTSDSEKLTSPVKGTVQYSPSFIFV